MEILSCFYPLATLNYSCCEHSGVSISVAVFNHLKWKQTLFYCTSQRLHVFTNSSLWQSCIEQVYGHHFSNSVCLLHVSLPHSWQFLQDFKFFHAYLLLWSVWLLQGLCQPRTLSPAYRGPCWPRAPSPTYRGPCWPRALSPTYRGPCWPHTPSPTL